MKKLLLILTAALLTTPVFAQLEQGQHLVGGRFGLAFQANSTGIHYGTEGFSVDWGSVGLEYSISYYYLLTKHLAVGGEFTFGDFSGWNVQNLFSSDKVNDDTLLFNNMLSARLTANPDSRIRLYLPLGVGLVTAKQNLNINTTEVQYHHKATDNSIGWFGGLGLEADIGHQGWSWGLEARYTAFWYDTNKLVRSAPATVKSGGVRRLDYLTFMLRVNKRF